VKSRNQQVVASGKIRLAGTTDRIRFADNHYAAFFLVVLALESVILYRIHFPDGISMSGWSFLLVVQFQLEVIASAYATFYLSVATLYRPPACAPRRADTILEVGKYAHIGVVYLCCDDLDSVALESIARVCHHASVPLFVHDDSRSDTARRQVVDKVRRLQELYGLTASIQRRPSCEGGKPGAVNNVIRSLPPQISYILLCDSDSFLSGPEVFQAARIFQDDQLVAIIQFRTEGYLDGRETPLYATLSESITFYDAFVSFLDFWGWPPFLGHNALLRVDAVKDVGGFTPGELADDIDLSVRLQLRGYRTVYIRNTVCGERHPRSYRSLRLRSRKWAYGCTQIIQNCGWSVITTNSIGANQKLCFLLTVAYYHFQAAMLMYLALFYIIFPFAPEASWRLPDIATGAFMILLLTFIPSITYYIGQGRASAWPRAALIWGFTYGSQDFEIILAIWSALWGKRLAWRPTNGSIECAQGRKFLAEYAFAAVVILIASFRHPVLLLVPTTMLFVGKFLAVHLLDRAISVYQRQTTPAEYRAIRNR
jgi:cellulose synthase/poly-beta-1,6-N-acetylglucosamine synthase-like glycosyltransferase